MSSDETAVGVFNLSKCYEIYEKPPDRLKQSTLPKLQRLVRRPPKQYYREFWALKDVSFEVKKGETLGIVGRNGSGKSTLLQIICGTLAPTSGSVETNGRVAALLELGSGFNPEFTGRENIFMNGAVLGLSEEEISARFDDIADFADIGDFIEQPIKTYSSGMVLRLAFAVAINVDPKILVVDEALAVGDELFQRKCFSRIEAIKRNGATILFVSHSGGTVVELCDRVMLLDLGEKVTIGAPKIVVGKYLRLLYVPDDKRNALREEIRKSGDGRHESDTVAIVDAPLEIKPDFDLPKGSEPEEFFDPNLIPQSTMCYESRGAFIEAPEIRTLTGRKVNCIVRGRNYNYAYKVRFNVAVANVRFGMLIKTISGLELGGGVSASNPAEAIPYLSAGSYVQVEFRFSCVLNQGTYFLNAGVVGSVGEDEIVLHRILDACMFRVLPVSDGTSASAVYFSVVPNVAITHVNDECGHSQA
ncbi:MAG: ABC transporter ATP-binding protein [Deltaproteobacteria bacterium]|nr:ABC transporter ATP-binding protein [Deltaproteobacteria bacterium]